MPTITKPKKPVNTLIISLKIEKGNWRSILDPLGYYEAAEKKQSAVITQLETILTYASNELKRLPDRPMPANIESELETVAKLTGKLADILQPGILSREARNLLPGIDDYIPWKMLHSMENQARIGIAVMQAQGRSDGGARNAKEKSLRERIRIELENFFKKTASPDVHPDDIKDCMQDFVKACFAALPPSPFHKRHTAD